MFISCASHHASGTSKSRYHCPPCEPRTRSPACTPADTEIDCNCVCGWRCGYGEDAGDADYSFVEEGDDDDFIDDEDDEEALRRKSKSEKGKGKAKKQARISVAPPSTSTYLDGSAFGTEVNPKVMLLSLKAGALGLNLTVANNVFL